MIGTGFRGFISALHANGGIDFWELDNRNINKRVGGNTGSSIDGPSGSDAKSGGNVSASRFLFCARHGGAMERLGLLVCPSSSYICRTK